MLRRRLTTSFALACIALWSLPGLTADEASGQLLGGSLNSPIKIEVFSDFQCPACRELYLSTIKKVLQDYSSKDKVCVIYHEFPLTMHQYAKEAARYSEAAAHLGQQKLLPVMDSLFSDQQQWAKDGSLELTVSKAVPGEDFQKIKKLLQDAGISANIDKEILLGTKMEIQSTPTLFISYPGKQQKVEGMVTYEILKQFIDSIVK
jgi:protein-disulfide isomerase